MNLVISGVTRRDSRERRGGEGRGDHACSFHTPGYLTREYGRNWVLSNSRGGLKNKTKKNNVYVTRRRNTQSNIYFSFVYWLLDYSLWLFPVDVIQIWMRSCSYTSLSLNCSIKVDFVTDWLPPRSGKQKQKDAQTLKASGFRHSSRFHKIISRETVVI